MAATKTFGYTTAGGSFASFEADRKIGCLFNMPERGIVSQISARIAGGGSSQLLVGLIYADEGGSPGARKAMSSPVTVAAGAGAAWVPFVFSVPANLPAGDYWLAILAGPTSGQAVYYLTEGARLQTRGNANTYADGASDPWGGETSVSSWRMSIYATYTVADTQAPSVEVTAPADGATVSGTISWTASASDNVGVQGVTFAVDGHWEVGYWDSTYPYGFSWDSTTWEDGSRVLECVAIDLAGNSTTSAPVTVTVANVADAASPKGEVATVVAL